MCYLYAYIQAILAQNQASTTLMSYRGNLEGDNNHPIYLSLASCQEIRLLLLNELIQFFVLVRNICKVVPPPVPWRKNATHSVTWHRVNGWLLEVQEHASVRNDLKFDALVWKSVEFMRGGKTVNKAYLARAKRRLHWEAFAHFPLAEALHTVASTTKRQQQQDILALASNF